jgi:itaconyl-CoA hydratase
MGVPGGRRALTGSANYFEDFNVGDRIKHARGTTVGEVENQLLTKLVMNTAQAHFNEHVMKDSPWGQRLVYGVDRDGSCHAGHRRERSR